MSTSAQPILFDDEEMLFDDDLLADDGDQLDDVELDDGPVVTKPADRAALARRDVYHGLVHCIVSNPKLWATVDVAEVKELMKGPLAALPDGPLILEPLWTYMLQKGTPRSAAAETLVFFHSRAERWQVSMLLPLELEQVEEERRSVVVEKMSARGVTTGTAIRMNPLLPETEPERAAQAKRRAQEKKKAVNAKKGVASASLTNIVRIALGLSVVVAVAVAALPESFAPNVEDRAAAALGAACVSTEQHGHALRCVTDASRLESERGMKERVDVTEAALDVSIVFVNAAGEPLALLGD